MVTGYGNQVPTRVTRRQIGPFWQTMGVLVYLMDDFITGELNGWNDRDVSIQLPPLIPIKSKTSKSIELPRQPVKKLRKKPMVPLAMPRPVKSRTSDAFGLEDPVAEGEMQRWRSERLMAARQMRQLAHVFPPVRNKMFLPFADTFPTAPFKGTSPGLKSTLELSRRAFQTYTQKCVGPSYKLPPMSLSASLAALTPNIQSIIFK